MDDRKIYVIDGENFSSMKEFYDEIQHVMLEGGYWGRNLAAFNDILRGGYGSVEDNGFAIRWKNSDLSKRHLGYEATVNQLTKALENCHPTNIAHLTRELEQARINEGQTMFEYIVEIIGDHGSGGREGKDDIKLYLE
ncbi:MAG: barstar family protein [Emcibacteraceae bacterium]|nr:barstar family protein [Emcibacteraceae bacterium]